jgi:acyl carrier protein
MVNNKKVIGFIKNLLQRKKAIPKNMLKNLEDFRYLDHGQIDSLELIMFISNIEKKYHFKFSATELASKEFRIVSGITKIILKKNNL